ncbi:MAG: enoyl-CoA hydratase/isomerase family protein [Candidatus Helarchaeota archaeon]
MTYKHVILKKDEDLGYITVNRPEKMNAFNKLVKQEFLDALDCLEHDDKIRVIIISGAGEKSFIAGDDVEEFATRSKEDFRPLQEITNKIENSKKPVIAAINGYALGGGAELALACDFRIATENSSFGFPEINLGIIPAAGGTQRLPRLIGKARALEMIMTGDFIDASKAEKIGLINKMVPRSKLNEETTKLARKLAKKSPHALKLAKKAINNSVMKGINEGLNLELDFIHELKETEQSKDLVENFLRKNRKK